MKFSRKFSKPLLPLQPLETQDEAFRKQYENYKEFNGNQESVYNFKKNSFI